MNFHRDEFKNLSMLFLLNNCLLDQTSRFSLNKKFLSYKKKFFKTQIKNRCFLTFRSRSPIRDFRLSRIAFRSLASTGLLLGVKKSS